MTMENVSTGDSSMMQSAALEYAAMGLAVFPLHTPVISPTGITCSCATPECVSHNNVGKHPRTQKGLKAATTDGDQIRDWWNRWPSANIGILTGRVSAGKDAGKSLVVIDVDVKYEGLKNWDSLLADCGGIPKTLEAVTGSGGRHILFYSDVPVKNSAGMIVDGVDVRGECGYVAAAPSLHKSGNRYAWKSHPRDTNIANIPEWVLEMATKKPAHTYTKCGHRDYR